MHITRINNFRAIDGKGAMLLERIKSFLPTIESSVGCLSCQLLQSKNDANHILLLEVWESIDAHQAALKNTPPGVFQEAKKLLAVPPTGEYYHG